MLSTSVIQTFKLLTSTCFSVIRDNIREHRKMMGNFKPGEHMRKMFIFSQSHLNLVLLACVAWRLLPTKPPCYAATFCSLQQALGSNQSKRLLRRLHRGRETNFIGVSPLRAGAPSSLACFSRASRSFLSPLLPSDCYAGYQFYGLRSHASPVAQYQQPECHRFDSYWEYQDFFSFPPVSLIESNIFFKYW